MLSLRKIVVSSLVVFHMICSAYIQEPRLATYDYRSVSVFPVFTHRNIKYGILAREGYGVSKKDKYDDFGGGRDKGEKDLFHSAAREFHEEAIIEKSLGLSLEDTKALMDQHLSDVIVYSKDKSADARSRDIRNVTYIVNFNKYKTELFKNFYDAYNVEEEHYNQLGVKRKHRHLTEKDRIAKVKWDDLKHAIVNQKDPKDFVHVCALVLDPVTRQFKKEVIVLRPFFVMKLRPFFCNHSYEEGEDERVRYYRG